MSEHALLGWDAFLEYLEKVDPSREQVGFDLEANGLHRFQEEICLVQVCRGEEVRLFDPLEGGELEPVRNWLKNAEIWMHGADYDMALFLMSWQCLPATIFDTQIAAQLLGYERFGYAALVEQNFQVELSKSSQKADWGRRPLPDKMLEYAVNDVRYLLPLANKLEGELREKGRHDWFLQNCEAAMKKVVDRSKEEREGWRISGAGKMNPKELLFLRALWEWRNDEAREWDRPPFMVCGNKQLMEWVGRLAKDERIDSPPRMKPQRFKRLLQKAEEARKTPSAEWPQRPVRERQTRTKNFDSRLEALMARRDKHAEELGISPSVIASRAILESIAGAKGLPEEILLPWQHELVIGG